MAKQVASSIGAVASFMPKPFSNDFRSGAHFNMSLASAANDANIFDHSHSPVGALGERYQIDFPDHAFHFVGGLLAHAPALTAICCPTHNSYKGLIAQGDMPDMSWAPVLRCYGRNNRSAMIRLPMNRPCVENRSPDISANFYLAAALSVAAGLDGVEHKTDPGVPWNENLYELVDGRPVVAGAMAEPTPDRLPRTLIEALDAFRSDPLVAEVYGTEFCDIFLRQKTKEWDQAFYRVYQEEREQQVEYV
jgi:glutamine synthetase